ncbi:MAG: elongation factor P, partial [Gammaproteobacteria bacterium]|nr:elongation factor P [Gammaproteobacteria bacterium]
MKTASEMKVNNVALIDSQPWLIQKAEYTKSGRNSAIVKMKLKNLLTGSSTETVYKFDDKMEA